MSTPGAFDNHLERLLSGSAAGQGGALDHATATIRCDLIDDTDWTANFATDVDKADVGAGAEVGSSTSSLDSPTITDGVFDAADEVIPSVSGDGIDSTLVFDYDAVEANAELMVLLDNGGSTTPNGNDITVQWDSGANKIYALT